MFNYHPELKIIEVKLYFDGTLTKLSFIQYQLQVIQIQIFYAFMNFSRQTFKDKYFNHTLTKT